MITEISEHVRTKTYGNPNTDTLFCHLKKNLLYFIEREKENEKQKDYKQIHK